MCKCIWKCHFQWEWWVVSRKFDFEGLPPRIWSWNFHQKIRVDELHYVCQFFYFNLRISCFALLVVSISFLPPTCPHAYTSTHLMVITIQYKIYHYRYADAVKKDHQHFLLQHQNRPSDVDNFCTGADSDCISHHYHHYHPVTIGTSINCCSLMIWQQCR